MAFKSIFMPGSAYPSSRYYDELDRYYTGTTKGNTGASGGGGGFAMGPSGTNYSSDDWYDRLISGNTVPSYVAPEDYVAPEYNAPEYSQEKIDTLTQRRASSGLRSLRAAMQKVQGGYYTNPNVKRMTLRDALAGYGQGVADVMGTASEKATKEYGQEYARELDTAKTKFGVDLTESQVNYQNKLTKAQADYNAQLAAWHQKNNALLQDYFSNKSSGSSGKSSGTTTKPFSAGHYDASSSYNKTWTPETDKWKGEDWYKSLSDYEKYYS